MQQDKVYVSALDAGKRLDQFLSENYNKTRSSIQKIIKQNLVTVNNQIEKSSYIVCEDDVIELSFTIEEDYNIVAEDIPLKIIYEDEDIIVINKEKGMVVHPGSGNYHGTLVNALLYHCNKLSEVNGETRPGIIHRIDKDTSGLIVCAKNDEAHVFISNQLQNKECFRKYYAIVNGILQHDEVLIDAPIGRSEKDRQKMTVTDKNSKHAVTKITVLKRLEKATIVECELETGRTHQIRVHCQYIKHGIVNDVKYGKRIFDDKGQVLHAHFLSFIHPKTKERVEFETGVPEYFDYYIKELSL